MNDVFDDVRFAVRVYRRQAASVALVVGGLAIAVGLTTALFAVMNAVLFRSVSVANQAELRWARAGGPGATIGAFTRTNWTLPEYRALQQLPGPGRVIGILQTSAPIHSANVTVAGSAPVWFVGAGFFESMSVRPVAIGTVAGAGCAALLGAALRGVLVGVSPVDPTSMLIGALVLFASGAIAIAGPARTAARVAPGRLLKEE